MPESTCSKTPKSCTCSPRAHEEHETRWRARRRCGCSSRGCAALRVGGTRPSATRQCCDERCSHSNSTCCSSRARGTSPTGTIATAAAPMCAYEHVNPSTTCRVPAPSTHAAAAPCRVANQYSSERRPCLAPMLKPSAELGGAAEHGLSRQLRHRHAPSLSVALSHSGAAARRQVDALGRPLPQSSSTTAARSRRGPRRSGARRW